MGEEQTLSSIQFLDPFQFLIGKSKIKHLEVFFHPFPVDRFGNNDYILLQKEPQGGLGCGLFVGRADLI